MFTLNRRIAESPHVRITTDIPSWLRIYPGVCFLGVRFSNQDVDQSLSPLPAGGFFVALHPRIAGLSTHKHRHPNAAAGVEGSIACSQKGRTPVSVRAGHRSSREAMGVTIARASLSPQVTTYRARASDDAGVTGAIVAELPREMAHRENHSNGGVDAAPESRHLHVLTPFNRGRCVPPTREHAHEGRLTMPLCSRMTKRKQPCPIGGDRIGPDGLPVCHVHDENGVYQRQMAEFKKLKAIKKQAKKDAKLRALQKTSREVQK